MRERNYTIDVLKGLAIISVILLHTLTWKHRFLIGAPYHIWQAVPVFMLLVGYNFSRSSIVKGCSTLNDVYRWPVIKRRLLKIIIPFIIIALVRFLLLLMLNNPVSWQSFLIGILMGDFEHGGYFIPVMIQTILLIPALYIFMQKDLKRNTLYLLISFYILDWVVMLLGMPGYLYRISVVRYLFIIVLGLWLGMNDQLIKYKWLILLGMGSLVYITSVYYFEIETILETYWQAQHAPAYFWTLILVVFSLNKINIKPTNIFNYSLIKTGQASYHIFLVQMIYFWLLDSLSINLTVLLSVIVNLIVCIILGRLFYKYS